MPSCILRVSGSKVKIKRFLSESTFEPIKVYFRGDPGILKSRGPNKTSGFNISLSGSHGTSLEKQARQAIKFINTQTKEFEELSKYNFKSTTLDFGLYDIASDEFPWPSYRLPKKLIQLSAEYGLEIELSFYGKPY